VHDASSKFDATRFNDMPVAVGERAATLSCARLFEVASGGIAMVRPLSADAGDKRAFTECEARRVVDRRRCTSKHGTGGGARK
jgi:hypothetical protein